MKKIGQTILEAGALCLFAMVVAFGANAVRAKGSIKVTKNYFDRGLRGLDAAGTRAPPAEPVQETREDVASTSSTPPAEAAVSGDDRSPTAAEKAHPEHGFQEVSFEEASALFADPLREVDVYVFVDARNDAAYADGHIPGAIQVDHYQVEDYIQNVLSVAPAAEKIIVYCNGGDCEDSIFVCGDLLEAGIPYEKIYLFAGGWQEWTAKGMPVARGR